jgi:hypothetical protein
MTDDSMNPARGGGGGSLDERRHSASARSSGGVRTNNNPPSSQRSIGSHGSVSSHGSGGGSAGSGGHDFQRSSFTQSPHHARTPRTPTARQHTMGRSSSYSKSRFSTHSAVVARRFLESDTSDDDDDESDAQEEEETSELYRGDEHSRDSTRKPEEEEKEELLAGESYIQNPTTMVYRDDVNAIGQEDDDDNEEDPYDLEWNPEQQRRQEQAWRNRQRQKTASAATGSQPLWKKKESATIAAAAAVDAADSHLFPRQPDLRNVDQTVNLMDASMGDYVHTAAAPKRKKKKPALTTLPTQQPQQQPPSWNLHGGNSTLVDIFLDTSIRDASSVRSHTRNNNGNTGLGGSGSETTARRRRRQQWQGSTSSHHYRENIVCQDLCCSWLTILLVLAAMVGAGIAWRTGAFVPTTTSSSSSATSAPAAAPENDWESVLPEATLTALKEFRSFLITQEISTQEQLDTLHSPQQLALEWMAHHGILEDPMALMEPSMGSGHGVPPSDYRHKLLLQAYALSVIYFSTNGYLTYNVTATGVSPNSKTVWHQNTHWMDPTRPLCQWYGLSCDPTKPLTTSIVQFNLTKNNLKGTLPMEVMISLTNLKSLDLSHNGLKGSFVLSSASAASAMPENDSGRRTAATSLPSSLEYLVLNHNHMTGNLPPSIGNLTQLQELHLNHNQWQGSLPTELNQLSLLRVLALQDNDLSGSIPYLEGLQQLGTYSIVQS